MEVIYCIGAYNGVQNLIKTVKNINTMFKDPLIFVASNGMQSLPNEMPNNVRFRYWGENQGWQLGALNNLLQAMRFAAENVENPSCPIMLTHEDTFPSNYNKVRWIFERLKYCDVFCRKYIGNCNHAEKSPLEMSLGEYPYLMGECIYFSPQSLKLFKNIVPYTELHRSKTNGQVMSTEEMLGYTICNMKLKVEYIPTIENSAMNDNEIGVFHNHPSHVRPVSYIL